VDFADLDKSAKIFIFQDNPNDSELRITRMMRGIYWW